MLNEAAFASPPREARGGPLWVWNDTMEEAVIDDQIAELADSGWGACFIHPRVGLDVEYLSGEWFRTVRHAVEAADEAGIDPWLYDEDRWPSGYAGGRVPARGPEYTVRALVAVTEPDEGDVVLDEFTRDGVRLVVCVRLGDADTYMTGRVNGNAYADLMNPDAVTAFLDATYESYADAVGDYFGDVIPGVFTDEPHVWFDPFDSDDGVAGYVPWTVGLPTVFESTYGYDLLGHLESLFVDRDTNDRDYRAVRYDFWRLVTERFVETYSRRLYEWCEAHDLALTGHYMHEDRIGYQIRAVGAVMPHYEYQHRPGVDCLARSQDGHGNDLALVQCSSVARQLGRRAFSELYGGAGQRLPFEARKWLADWHLVHDVTLLNPHLSLYSMRGERKRDFPPNLFYQQPWWPYNDRFADYVARIAHALDRGEPAADTLIVHPVRSGWLEYTSDDAAAVDALDDRFADLLDTLLAAHVPFDLGDERIMARHGDVVVNDDEATGGESTTPRLRVGEVDYSTVVVPYCRTVEASTVDLLEMFMDAGGTVLVVGDPPELIEGRPAPEELEGVRAHADRVPPADVPDVAARPVRLRGADGEEAAGAVRVHVRRCEDGVVLFLANTDRGTSRDCTLDIAGTGRLTRWNPVDGTREPLAPTGDRERIRTSGDRRGEGSTRIDVTVPETGSLLVTLDETAAPVEDGAGLTASPGAGDREVSLPEEWTLARDEPNQLVVDECHLVLDGIDEGVSNVAEHWPHETAVDDPETHVPYSATYRFDVSPAVADGRLSLVVESADEQHVTFNGTDLAESDGRWRDVHWHRFDVTDLVRAGTNELVLEGVRSPTVGVEPVYVLGPFAVDDAHRLVPEPDRVRHRDVTTEGYPFYTGEFTLTTTVTLADPFEGSVRFDEVHATLATVQVDDGEPQERYWPPWEVPVTLQPGQHRVAVTLVTSLRNLTGPHHAHVAEPTAVAPATFRHPDADTGRREYLEDHGWDEGYRVVPVGFEGPRLVER
jgi:hypothetical protein